MYEHNRCATPDLLLDDEMCVDLSKRDVKLQIFVNEMESIGPENPVLYFKPAGLEDPNYQLAEEDFVLIVMTQFQQAHIKMFDCEEVCVDRARGCDGFELVMLLTVDESGNGCPVAVCFSSKWDDVVLRLFFRKIRDQVGFLDVDTFMSDVGDCVSNAWSLVMGAPKNILWCCWYVEQCWKENLNHIRNEEKRQMVYDSLKVLEKLPDKEKFEVLLRKLGNTLCGDDDTRIFGDYFKRVFVDFPECWATSCQAGLTFDSNNFIESFHKVLKCNYLGGEKVSCLDEAINAAMRVVRDCFFKRLVSLSTRKDYLIEEMQKSHKESRDIDENLISVVDGCKMLVRCVNEEGHYEVWKVSDMCEGSCVKCIPCQICVHSFKCTCTNNVLKSIICKHIHACSILFYPNADYDSSVDEGVSNEDFNLDWTDESGGNLEKKIDVLKNLIESNDKSSLPDIELYRSLLAKVTGQEVEVNEEPAVKVRKVRVINKVASPKKKRKRRRWRRKY